MSNSTPQDILTGYIKGACLRYFCLNICRMNMKQTITSFSNVCQSISLFNYSASLHCQSLNNCTRPKSFFYYHWCGDLVQVFSCSNQQFWATKQRVRVCYSSGEGSDQSAEASGERSRPTAPPGNRSWHIRTMSLLRGGRRINGFSDSSSAGPALLHSPANQQRGLKKRLFLTVMVPQQRTEGQRSGGGSRLWSLFLPPF